MGQSQRVICAPVVADPAPGASINNLLPVPMCPSETSPLVGALYRTWFSFDRKYYDLRLTPSPNPKIHAPITPTTREISRIETAVRTFVRIINNYV